jgi:hypothetical protein
MSRRTDELRPELLKICERLGGALDDPFPQMLKGWHGKTYQRLEELDQQLQWRWMVGLARRFRLFERL